VANPQALAKTDGVMIKTEPTSPVWYPLISPFRPGSGFYHSGRREIVYLAFNEDLTSIYNQSVRIWSFDGDVWHELTTDGPPNRQSFAYAYDSEKNQLVLFGGVSRDATTDANIFYDDTWIWDGRVWRSVSSSTHPSARADQVMAYDSVRKRVMLFGGSAGTDLGDTWVFENNQWIQLTGGVQPTPRRFGSMEFDKGRSKMVLVGGANANSGGIPIHYEHDGSNWISVGASPWPGAYFPSLAYDVSRQQMVAYGGDSTGAMKAFTGTQWVTASSLPPLQVPNQKVKLAFDEKTQSLRALWDSGPVHTAELKGTPLSWSENTPARNSMPPRFGHRSAFNSDSNSVIMFGGDADDASTVTVKELASNSWNPMSAVIPTRQRSVFTFDLARHKTVVFGGFFPLPNTGYAGDPSIVLNETFEFFDGGWVNRTAQAGVIPAIHSAAFAYDSTRQKTVVFGGTLRDGGLNAQTYEYNGTWSVGSGAGPIPSSRTSAAMVFHEQRQKIMMFGGYKAPNGNPVPNAEFWEYGAGGWTPLLVAGPKPLARFFHQMSYDSVRNRVVLFGGSNNSTDLFDTWEFDGTNWIENRRSRLFPRCSFDYSLTYDKTKERSVLHGGRWTREGTWFYGFESGTKPALKATFNVASASAENISIQSVSVRALAGASSTSPGAGLFLQSENKDAFRAVASHLAPRQSPQWLEYRTTSPADIASLFVGGEKSVVLGVVPMFPSDDTAALQPELVTDVVEMRIRYQRP
jgi:hypothetical protein